VTLRIAIVDIPGKLDSRGGAHAQALPFKFSLLDVSRPGLQPSTSRALSWIQCKLGKQYLEKKFTLPWESNPGPTPIRGGPATILASVGLKYILAS